MLAYSSIHIGVRFPTQKSKQTTFALFYRHVIFTENIPNSKQGYHE